MRTKPFFHTDERNRRRQLPIIKQQRHLFLPLLTPQHRFSHSRKHGDSQRHSQKTGGLERAKDQIRQIDRAAPYASTSRHNPYRTRAAPVAPYLTQKDVSCVCARRASGTFLCVTRRSSCGRQTYCSPLPSLPSHGSLRPSPSPCTLTAFVDHRSLVKIIFHSHLFHSYNFYHRAEILSSTRVKTRS